jgi:WD40 repeat protein
MNVFKLILVFLFFIKNASAQNEPRLVLPIGHTSNISDAFFSSNNKLVITQSDDHTIRFWDVESGKELSSFPGISIYGVSNDEKLLLTTLDYETLILYSIEKQKELFKLNGHNGEINSACFDRENKLIVTTSEDSTAIVWDVNTGKKLFVLNDGDYVFKATFCNDNKHIITETINSVRVWDITTGKLVRVFQNEDFGGTDLWKLSQDNKFLIAQCEGNLKYWDFFSGKLINNNEDESDITIPLSNVNKLVLTSNHGLVATVFDLVDGHKTLLNGHNDRIHQACFSSDDKLVLTVSDGHAELFTNPVYKENRDISIRIWDSKKGTELQKLIGHEVNIKSALFSYDNKFVLSTSWDATARIWDVSSGKQIHVFKKESIFDLARFSSDNRLVLTISGKEITLWDVKSGKELRTFGGKTVDMERPYPYHDSQSTFLSSDNKYLFSIFDLDSNNTNLWDIEKGKLIKLIGQNSKINYASFNYDNLKLLTASDDSTARVWDIKTGKTILELKGHDNKVNYSSFSNDNKFIVTMDDFNTLRIWNNETGNLIYTFDTTEFKSLSYDDEYLLTSSIGSNKFKIWNMKNGLLIKEFITMDVDDTLSRGNSFCFDVNSELLLTSRENKSFIFDAVNGKLISNFDGHKTNIYRKKLTSKYAFTISEDNILMVWNPKTGTEISRYQFNKGIKSINIDENGKYIVFLADSLIYVWDSVNIKINKINSNRFIEIDVPVIFVSDNLIIKEKHSYGGSEIIIWDLKTFEKTHHFTNADDIILNAKNDICLIISSKFNEFKFYNLNSKKYLYTFLQLKNKDWLAYDEHYRFDGTTGAIDYLYLTCGLEVIDLAQVKDSLWVPGLVEKIMKGEEIKINDKPAPKLRDLNICDLTPQIEQLNKDEKGIFKYKITPRKGGLGETEIYINGNLTYSLKPSQLEKKLENKKEFYYLTISTDSLQSYLVGELNSENPIVVKSKVKGAGIYGRGSTSKLIKTTKQEMPHFYGVFVGVNEYGNSSKEENDFRYKNLDFAKKDAEDLANTVEATAKTLFKENCHIYRLTNTSITDSVPNKNNLIKVLDDISKKSKASDVLYIFFAGHGDIKQKQNEKEIRFILQSADKKNLNSSSFGIDELTEWCSPKKIKAQKRVFVFDACHSGQVINQTLAFNGRGDDESNRIRQLDKLKDKNGMMILAASADNESAYEDESLNQGVLTYHLLQVVKQQQKDTSLIVRNWFDETIELVKEYSRMNGNKQEPSSFGDGRFEIGNIDKSVRNSVSIEEPKIRIGNCTFIDPIGDAENLYPNLKDKINTYFKNSSTRGDFVFSKNSDKSYKIVGAYTLVGKNKLKIGYKIYLAEEQIGSTITFPLFKNKSEDEIYEILLNSIEENLKKLNNIEKNN